MKFIILILLISLVKGWNPLDPVEYFCDTTFMWDPTSNTVCKVVGKFIQQIPSWLCPKAIKLGIDVLYKNIRDKIPNDVGKDLIDEVYNKLLNYTQQNY